jgi:hypothetical protein
VQDLQVSVASRVSKLVLAPAKLQEGLTFWGRAILLGAGGRRVEHQAGRCQGLPRVASGLQHGRETQQFPTRRGGSDGTETRS